MVLLPNNDAVKLIKVYQRSMMDGMPVALNFTLPGKYRLEKFFSIGKKEKPKKPTAS